MNSILKKELVAYFGSWNAYFIASLFVLVCSLFLWFFENNFNFFTIGIASLQSFFNFSPWVLMFLIPALTMKAFAEEKQQGTLSWLFTKPLSLNAIWVGKFLALLIVVLFCLLPTFVYVYSMKQLSLEQGIIDIGIVISGYLGLFLLSCSFAAIGIFTSSLANNQVLAYLSGVFLCMICFFGLESLASFDLLGKFDYYLQRIGCFSHYKSFTKGIVDTRDVFYFLIVTTIFSMLSLYLIQRKK